MHDVHLCLAPLSQYFVESIFPAVTVRLAGERC